MFRESINQIQYTFATIKDPKQLMQAFTDIQELVGKQYQIYKEAEDNTKLREQVAKHMAQNPDKDKLFEHLDTHLQQFSAYKQT